ncbi:Ubiquitin-like domain-containing protein CIP73 [Bienertia sinuspersici]
MAEQQSAEGASTSDGSVSGADSTVEINIKTLDSQMYNFHVEQNMPVSLFKGKIADQIGVPVGQQRLIFRGKVLKDEHLLSEYHVENGDTLHLVERQPTQPQTSSADTSGTIGAQGAPRNRIGQISHSVVLGTLNVGDQGEGGASDLNRVIGAVLNSLGVGNQTASTGFGAPNTAANPSGPIPQGNDAERGRGGNGSQSQAGNQAQFGQPFSSQPFQVPLPGISIPSPSLNMPIPDSLNTLSEFMSRMEGVLSQNGNQPSLSPSSTADQPAPELPSNTRGLPTPEALTIVLRHAQRLLSGPAVAALSKRNRQSQMQFVSGEADASSSPDQGQQARISGQQILQSLASRSTAGRSSLDDSGSGQTAQGLGQAMEAMQASAQDTDGQLDVTGAMSQLIQSPALNGLLSGVAQQTGVGSPDVLRNMLQQFTQNPAMRNTVNQLAQQVDREEFQNMFTSMGTSEDGSPDFSSMFQQMMPVVSQVLGGGSVQSEQLQNTMPQLLQQSDGRSLEENFFGQVSQEVVQRIALHSPSQDIFQAMVQNAAECVDGAEGELIDGLCSNQDLVDEFVEMLRRDLRHRLQENSASGGNS